VESKSKDLKIVAQIKKQYGSVIDLKKSPMKIIEIIHNFRYLLDEVAGPDGTGGGPPGSPPPPAEIGSVAVLNLLLELKRDVETIKSRVKAQPSPAKRRVTKTRS
jgi:hypothetical protein